MKLENCTADPRTLVAHLPSGARAVLTLGPGEVSKEIDAEAVKVLRSNPAVELLFRHKLIREYKPKPKAESKPKPPVPKAPAKAKAKPKVELDFEV